ncbi:hypothetical protein KAM339_023080 [Aeromonas caviae]|uniref:BRO-N domain-containing protein n=1 Tax=Aeromonas caviae TaxID=648 RepID=UPI001CC3DDBC|nr:hypothetical protein KAM339_023080 [Aeromonas caviae]
MDELRKELPADLQVACDVAEALGYTDKDYAIRTHCKRAQQLPGDFSGSLDSRLKLIPESDVYRLVMRSKLESAVTPKAATA